MCAVPSAKRRQRPDRPSAPAASPPMGDRALPAPDRPSAPIAYALWVPEAVRGRGDREVARIAECQRGFVHRSQLLLAGLTPAAIKHRMKTGMLHLGFPNVYLVGRPRVEPLGRETAAVLFLEGHGVLSGLTAAVKLWEAIDLELDRVTITSIGRDARSRRGLRISHGPALARRDLRLRHGLPVTSPARTALDCAGELTVPELEALLGGFRRFVRDAEILAATERWPHAKGVATIRRLLAQDGGPVRTRSEYERRLLRLIRDAQLPAPQVNQLIGGLEVDYVWREQRLVVEFDGFRYHGGRSAFENDRARDRRLALLGYQVLRITARQLDETPLVVIAAIAAMLSRRAAAA